MRDRLTAHAMVDCVDAPHVERLPAMLPNLHLRLAGTTAYAIGDGAMVDAPAVTLIGPTMSSYRVLLGRGAHMLATGFLPSGWRDLIGVPARELTDRVIDAAAIWGDRAIDRLLDQLHCAPCESAAFDRFEAFLLRAGGSTPERSDPLALAVDYWLEHSPRLALADLQSLLGVGDRHMRRIVIETHGTSPKALAMKYRALRVAAAMAIDGAPAIEAMVSPYADQAHFIRDFRRFVGWTPGAFLTEQRNIAAHTLAGRKRAGIVRPLSLWS